MPNRRMIWIPLAVWIGMSMGAWLFRDTSRGHLWVEAKHVRLESVEQREEEGSSVPERFRATIPGDERRGAIIVGVDQKWLDHYGLRMAKVNLAVSTAMLLVLGALHWRDRKRVAPVGEENGAASDESARGGPCERERKET